MKSSCTLKVRIRNRLLASLSLLSLHLFCQWRVLSHGWESFVFLYEILAVSYASTAFAAISFGSNASVALWLRLIICFISRLLIMLMIRKNRWSFYTNRNVRLIFLSLNCLRLTNSSRWLLLRLCKPNLRCAPRLGNYLFILDNLRIWKVLILRLLIKPWRIQKWLARFNNSIVFLIHFLLLSFQLGIGIIAQKLFAWRWGT